MDETKEKKGMTIKKPDWMTIKTGRHGFGAKVVIITIMIFLFLIPLAMIQDLIREREDRKYQAEYDIISSWGGETAIGGPVLVIPRIVRQNIMDEKGEILRVEEYTEQTYLLPRSLNIDARSSSEIKSRGIFDVPVFTLALNGKGEFALEALYKNYNSDDLLWDQAFLQFSYPELKGMKRTDSLIWDGTPLDFESGSSGTAFYGASLNVPVDIGDGGARDISRVHSFRFSQEIRGGRSLEFLPLAGETRVNLESDWSSPSFQGYYLPTEQDIDEGGFSAEWEVNSLSRSVPETWSESDQQVFQDMRNSAFGLNYFPEFDSYQKTRRTIDYGVLFLILPFLTFFLFELIGRVRIHPVQYLLAGGGNILFYLILLSLSEHLAFNPSYFIASGAVTLLLSLYTLSISGIGRKAFMMLPVLCSGYGYLFFVLKSEDYALVMGTAGLFAALAFTMYLTRSIKWYEE